MVVHLIQPRDLFGPNERQDELLRCWTVNDGLFDHYSYPVGQPAFSELFALCKPGMVNVICNADIYFDVASVEWMRGHCPPRYCLALSRWDVKPDGSCALWDHCDSQDVWVFYGQPQGIDTTYTKRDGKKAEIRVGIAGCDNAIAHRVKQAGFNIINPSKTIRSYHLHNVQWRSYLMDPEGRARGGGKIERIPPPYHLIHPTTL